MKETPNPVNRTDTKTGGIERNDMKIPRNACTVIKAHHELMKDDSERLSTDFIQSTIGKKCDT
jgi:hypothetical protein